MTVLPAAQPVSDHPRVAALVAAYAAADAAMRDLPIYNPVLAVEGTAFYPVEGEGLLGILITPWFMNLVILPETTVPFDPARCGASRKVALPGGPRAFRAAGDAGLGTIWTASLHSPMDVFHSPAQARAEARLRLAEALTPPVADTSAPACPGRRAFLGGRIAGT